jgi:pyruvate-ferredoxin/flavodoxin oxidoreductase
LFEDNAEFGLGIKLATDKKREIAIRLLKVLREEVGSELADAILSNTENSEAEMIRQRKHVNELKNRLRELRREDSFRYTR